ncbi:MAG: hypothetical protein HOW73_19665 [Polyangiaceae bacterium]|nr:hypothetical protein [Polyangiaceae bacterium]
MRIGSLSRSVVVIALVIPVINCSGTAAESSPRSGADVSASASERPLGFEKLGGKCVTSVALSETTSTHIVRCAEDDTIAAVEWLLADVVQAPKDDVASHHEWSLPENGQSSEFQILVTGDAIWMRLARPTRRLSGFTVMALPAKLKDADLAALQARAGLADSPLLRTTEAWSDALEKGLGKPDPTRGWP